MTARALRDCTGGIRNGLCEGRDGRCFGGEVDPDWCDWFWEDVVLGEHDQEFFNGLFGAVVDFEAEEVPDVVLGEVGGPTGAFGVGGDEPIDAGLVFEHGALEDVGGGDDVGFGLGTVLIIEV